ncbi:siderophore ABC transporter substrate-binding protein [Enemella sp. A6]|uniref:siderophore ABC transporter substrate-binding protein n=1 Tax=Enemella sp. A6 TaxID=3440152 RepID=UPI003EB733D3
MTTTLQGRLALIGGLAAALALTACATDSGADTGPGTGGEAKTVQIEDNHGTHEVPVNPAKVVATDSRSFETLSQWNIELTAAPKRLMSSELSYRKDESIIDLGTHKEPDLEAIVAAEPDVVINGQRFAQHYADIKKLAPDATMIELDPREGEPLDAELRRQTEGLGKIFDKQDEAAQLVTDFDTSIERVKAAYKSGDKVMAVITSGGEINYAAPGSGRTLGPVFDILGLTPALEAEGSTDHQGDDISVEAIAQSNPDWILVMDRDAAISANTGEKYTPANELLAESPALKNVTAVQKGQIVYMPADTYINESIQTYTEFFNALAEAMEKAN